MNTRQRFTSLYVYATEANARNNTNGTEYTSGIVDGSQRYEHTSLSSLPGFGEANAAMYECEIAETTDLTGKWIRVKYSYYATDSATTLTDKWIFLGKVDSCKYDKQKLTRKLIAYDKLYELRNVDISSWWLTYWASASGNVYARTLLVDACTQFGVAQAFASSLRNNFTVYKAAQNGRNLGGCTFADLLRYVGEITGSLFWINGSGNLVYSYLMEQTPTDISNNIDTTETEIADTDLAGYGTMMAYDGADIIYTGGSGSPVYTISDNVLLYGRSTANIVSLLDTTRGYLAYIVGLRPATIPLIVAEESFLAVGRAYVTFPDGSDTRTCLITSVECSGSQLIDMTLTCTGDMVTGTQYNQAMSKAANDIQDIGVQLTYKVNADGVIEAVNAEASDTIKIQARALDINGIVTANNNFKINLDGSMETIAGKIAGWIIEQTRLYKTRGDVTVELYAGDSTHSPRVRVYGTGKYVEMGDGAFTSTENYNGSTNAAQGTVIANGRELTITRSDWEEHSTWSDWVQTFLTTLKDSKLTLKRNVWNDTTSQYDEIETYVDYNGIHAANEVYAKGRNLLDEFKPFTAFFATLIPNNSNLNTTAFLNPGRYYIGSSANAATLTNAPTANAFYMDVDYPISALDRPASTYAYIHRTITTYNGAVFFQYVYGGATAGVYTYGSWVCVRYNGAQGNTLTQVRTNDSNEYQLLFSEVAGRDSNNQTARARKCEGLYYNPASGAVYIRRMHNATATNQSSLLLGNSVADGSQGASHGVLWIYGKGEKWARFEDTDNVLTGNRIYTLPNKDGELAILSPDTFNVGNRVIEVTGADVARSIRIGTKAGGYVYLTYFANGGHGLYSSGYESDIADSSTFTSSNKWIIRRNSAGNVFVDEWASIGSSGRPVYFSSSGRPVAVTETTGSGTRNTTTTTGGTCSYVKQGKIVSVTAYGVALRAGVADGNNLFTGLPAAAAEHHVGFPCVNAGSQTDYTGIEAYVDTSGNLKFKRGGTLNGKYYAASFTYISAS